MTKILILMKFFPSLNFLTQELKSLFKTKCPHCNQIGYLLKHSKIYRASKVKNKTKYHGQRVFCSNRNNNNGCGKTFPLNLTIKLPRLNLHTKETSKFLLHYIDSKSARKSWMKHFKNCDDITKPYRFLQLANKSICKLRPFLCTLARPPDKKDKTNCLDLFKHISNAFQSNENCLKFLIIAFQGRIF